MMLIVFSGLPGTGKTALAEFTGRTRRLPVFSVAWVIGALSPFGLLDRANRGPVAYSVLTMLAQLHRRRIEARDENIPGWPDPGWDHVKEMSGRYERWPSPRLVIDSVNPLSENQDAVLRYLETGSATPGGP